MNDHFEKLTAAAETVRLTQEEKDSSRRFLVSYMQMRPIRTKAAVREARFAFPSWFASSRAWSVVASVLVVTLAGGGVSYAAEGSVPGDALYPVKVRVNEEVFAAVAVSPRAKASWEAKRAERRLEEVEKLVERKSFDAGSQERLQEAFDGFADRVDERVAELERQDDVEGAAEVSERMETAMRAHQRVLERLAEQESNGVGTALRAFADAVEGRADSATAFREEVEKTLPERSEDRVKRAASDRRESVRRELESAKRNREQRGGKADPREIAPFDDTMLGATAAISAAEEAMEKGDFTGAFKKFGKAHRDIRQADLELRLPVPGGRDADVDQDDGSGRDAEGASTDPVPEDAEEESRDKDRVDDDGEDADEDNDARREKIDVNVDLNLNLR